MTTDRKLRHHRPDGDRAEVPDALAQILGNVDFVVFVPWMFLTAPLFEAELPLMLKACLHVVSAAFGPAYEVIMHWRYGATVGKLAFGLRVLDVAEKPISLKQALLREAIPIVQATLSTVPEVARIAAGQSGSVTAATDSLEIRMFAAILAT